jgi:chemotaxis protein methyltransferase CheR
LDGLLAWILASAGLDSGAYRASALERRMPALLRRLRVADEMAARQQLAGNPELMERAVNCLLIGVTEFFRDPAVFERLEQSILPSLLATRQGIRVCSVGASKGHELYSVAILLAEAGALETSELLGLDCRAEPIAAAGLGCFSQEEVASLKPVWRDRYFEPYEDVWLARSELRRALSWRVEDLFTWQSSPSWDLILFRNVAIYLAEEAAVVAWRRLYDRLAPGGVLITGKADQPHASLPLIRLGPSIYQKPHES